MSASRPVASQVLADAPAREQAVTDVARNLCVVAGAGSGKTSLLVERVLHLLLALDVAPEQIVAITFTEKAAAEMRQRVRAALAAVLQALGEEADLAAAALRAPKDSEAQRVLQRTARTPVRASAIRQRALAALESESTLTTIHSFALRLLRRHPTEAQVPAGVEMDVGEGFRRHATDLLPGLVEEALAHPVRGPALAAVLVDVTVDDLLELAIDLAWLPTAAEERSPAADPLAPLRPRLEALEQELRADRGRIAFGKRAHALEAQWDHHLDALRHLREHGLGPLGRLELPAPVAESIDKKLSTSESFAGKDVADATAARKRLEDAHSLLRQLARVDEAFVSRVLTATRPLADALREGFLRRGFISADGALSFAARLLSEHPDVRRAERRAIRHLLVDEFQDTDPLQCDLVLLLSEDEDAAPAKRAADVKLAPGCLFLVGDPKQSIYRFRGADLDVYTSAVNKVVEQGGARLDLVTSFRAPPRLVEPVNAVFSAWTDRDNDAEAPYARLVSSRERQERGSEPATFQVWSVEREDQERAAPARRQAEGRAIAESIAARLAAGVPPGRIVLLLRTLSELRHYLQPLRDLRIPFALSGGRTFVQRNEVSELVSLLLAAADPEDEVASLGALRSSLLAVPDAALLAAKREAGSLRWPALRDAKDADVRAAAEMLARFHDELATRPVVDAVERFVEGSPLLAVAASARDGEQRIANLRKLARDSAAAAQRDGRPLADVLRELVARRKRVEGDSESSLADVDVDAVRILTIHKAKGLEFHTVIVGDVARARRPRRAVDPGATLAPDGVAVRIGAACNVAQVVRDERDERHELAESKRLFYVAATRAKEELVLVVGESDQGSAPWLEPLETLGYRRDAALPDGALDHPDVLHRRLVMPERRTEPRRSRPLEAPALSKLADSVARFERAVAAVREPGALFARPSAHDDVADRAFAFGGDEIGDGEAGEGLSPARELARAVGVACHLALARSGPKRPPTPAQIVAAAREACQDLAVSPQDVAREAVAILTSAPARALFESLAHVEPIAVEIPIVLARDGRRWRGTADVVFRDRGRVVVGDWKTDRTLDRDPDLVEFARRYRSQLEIYRDALQTALRLAEAPATELLLLRQGKRLAL